MQQINVGIIGFGTVGSGACEILKTNRDLISNRIGSHINVKKIADLDIKSDRGVPIDQGVLTTNVMEIIDDPEIDIVVELIGGIVKAKEFILMALAKGKHVITANKALLAEHGKEIYEAANKNGVTLGFEASVAGGIPTIGALKSGLAANRIHTVMGILNGTSNYILTKMTKEGLPYDQVVQEAIKLGYAEDPPTLDVDGTDAAHKLAIIISILYGQPLSFDKIYKEGISDLSPDDIQFAKEFGYSIKLLAIARETQEGMEARVHPTMVPKNHILANVNDAFNAIYYDADFVGPNLYYGLGAGRRPTGSAVVSDIIEIARYIRLGSKEFMPPLAHFNPPEKDVRIKPMNDLVCNYYFRFTALDKPNVLSKIAGILGENHIGISSVIQKRREANESVPLVILTHEAKERDVQKALEQLGKLHVLTDKTAMIRVEK